MRRLMIGLSLGVASVTLITLVYAANTTPRHGLPYTSNADQNRALDKIDGAIPLSHYSSPIPLQTVIFCGQLPNNDTSWFLGPATGADSAAAGIGAAANAGGTVCDGLDSTTETTADAPVFINFPVSPVGMICRAVTDAGAPGSGTAGVTFTLRAATAAVSPTIACTVPTGGYECAYFLSSDATAPSIAAGMDMDIGTGTTENLSANDGWCEVFFAVNTNATPTTTTTTTTTTT